MKNIFLLSICSAFLLLSCKKESRPFNYRYPLAQNPAWSTEDFKSHYTIQFPNDYLGGKQVTTFGDIFCKYNTTDSLFFVFQNGLWLFEDFEGYSGSPAISDTTQQNIKDGIYRYSFPFDPNHVDSFYLNSKIDFVDADSLIGMFFYADYYPKSAGILYWKDKNEYDTKAVFKKALFAYYKKENLPTLIEIMRTIKRK